VLFIKKIAQTDTVQQIMHQDFRMNMILLFYMMKKEITRTGTQPISRLFEWFAPKIPEDGG
jgi:hypothetical protein